MKDEKEPIQSDRGESEKNDRRDALKKLGKYSAYAAPFTLLALSKKASAATGHGPGRHH
jgi:hypothetical protein